MLPRGLPYEYYYLGLKLNVIGNNYRGDASVPEQCRYWVTTAFYSTNTVLKCRPSWLLSASDTGSVWNSGMMRVVAAMLPTGVSGAWGASGGGGGV